MKNRRKIYKKRVEYYSILAVKLSKQLNLITNLRLLVIAVSIISTIFLIKFKTDYVLWLIPILFLVFFIYLVTIHSKLRNKNEYITALKQINEFSIKRLDGEWINFMDNGEGFKEETHPFSNDLDLFGKGSLFQWINVSKTYIGRIQLANMFKESFKDNEIIKKRQEAIDELSSKRWWRQRLEAEGMMIKERENNHEDLFNWANNKNELYSKPWIIFILRIFPLVTIITLVLAYLMNTISKNIPAGLLFIQLFLNLIGITKRNRELNLVYDYKDRIKVYKKILKHFEKKQFHASYLHELKKGLIDMDGITATEQLNKLEILVESILNRNNFMFFPINIITLWDYQCMIDLEHWKSQSGLLIGKWMDTLGKIEALSSLAIIGYDHPNWTTPIITNKTSIFKAKSIGHPLIINEPVYNDVNIQEPSKVLLITGSNMSGKSTLLRTIGINLVLAYLGAPVCAQSMECSVMEIYTCMRTSDNLEKSISSFYGELLRIKKIVEATECEKQIFFLLDEIFKGTNSRERHIGAKVLIKQLYSKGAMGLVSTHDLELGELEEESNGNFKNYHFQEYYKNNKIYFDYKLKPGICTTSNALYLIKMMGIEIDT